MAFRKFQKTEKASVLSQDEHQQVQDKLHQLGKTSATRLTEEERKATFNKQLADRN